MPETSPAETGINRRQILVGSAVAVPAIVLSTSIPARATSASSTLTVDIATSITSGDYSDVTVTVLDSQGNPWAGQTVNLAATGTTGIGLDATSGVTNSAGVFTTRLTTTISTPVGDTAVITATSGPLSIAGTATIAPVVLTITPAPTELHNNTIHVRAGEGNALTATLTFVSGRPIAGEGVSLSVSGFNATFGAYNSASPTWVTSVTGTTDGSGVFTASLTPEETLFGETATLTATPLTGPTSRTASAITTPTLTATNTNAYAVGWNAGGQLGDGTTTNRVTPTRTVRVFPSPIKQISTGGSGSWLNADAYASATNFATLFLLADGTVWSSGSDTFGMNGVPGAGSPNPYIVTPQIIPGLSNVKQVAVGSQTSYALTNGGAVYTWGVNTYGERGTPRLGRTTTVPGPVESLTSGVTQIAVGNRFAFALTDSGSIKAWGTDRQYYYQYGYPTPTDLDLSNIDGTVTSIAASGTAGYALADGKVYAWGQGGVGQLGNGTNLSTVQPQLVPDLPDITQIATTWSTCFVLTDSGGVISWGADTGHIGSSPASGLLGDNSPSGSTRNSPGDVSGLTSGVRSITGIGGTAYALMEDGSVTAWGSDTLGQFGNGTASAGSAIPTPAATAITTTEALDSLLAPSPFAVSAFFITIA